jgi:hypothetical protein
VGYEPPDEDLVRRALARVGDLQHRRVLYEGLENPLWVEPLDKEHAFDEAPEAAADEAGGIRTRPWPEGDYLARMAPLVPEAVARVLLRHVATENPYIQQLIIQAAASMPGALAVQFVPALDSYIRKHVLQWNASTLTTLVRGLMTAGEEDAALRLAHAAFRPHSASEGEGSAPRSGGDVVAGLEPYLYAETLPGVVAALTPIGLTLLHDLVIWLEEYQKAARSWNAETKSDTSVIWRPSVPSHEQNHGFDEIGEALVDAVRDLALEELSSGRAIEDVCAVLDASDHPLLARVALHVLTRAVASGDTAAIQMAPSRLMNARFAAVDYIHEYSELAHTALPLLPHSEVTKWSQFVADGPPVPESELRQRVRRFSSSSDEPEDDAVERYREIWRWRLLTAIGADRLPADLAQMLTQLEATNGIYEHADFASYMTSGWVERRSPWSVEELATFSVQEIADLLRTWRPDEGQDHFGGNSVEGLGEALRLAVRTRPVEFSAQASLFVGLPPTYIREYFSGLEEAVREGASLEWAQLLDLAEIVSGEPDDGSSGSYSGEGVESVWRYAQRAVIACVDQAVTSDGSAALPVALLQRAADVIASLMTHPDPTPDHERQYGGDNMDPLTLSLNSTRPAAVRAMGHVARRAKAESDSSSNEGAGVLAFALARLTARFGPDIDASLSVAAAFGEAWASLMWVDETWTQRALQQLLTPQETNETVGYRDVVVTTALTTYNPSLRLLESLAPAVADLIARSGNGEAITLGWRANMNVAEIVGDHLLLLVVRGSISSDHPLVEQFFANATVADRASALGHLGWRLMHAEDLPDAIVSRARELWDLRAAAVAAGQSDLGELVGFYWWVRSEKFELDWWLPRLQQAVLSGDFDPHGMIGAQLEAAAAEAPAATLDVLQAMLSHRSAAFRRFDLIDHAPAVIAAALDSGDTATIAEAQSLIDELGRDGHLRIEDLVRAHRRPT